MLVALGLGGALLVYGLSTQTWGGRGTADRPLRRVGAALGALFAGADDLVRRWSTATASLLLLVMLLGGLLLAGQPG